MDFSKKVYIPHLGYMVYLRDYREATGRARELLRTKYVALTHRQNNMSTIYMDLPIDYWDIPYLVHEIEHVLQYISEDYGMNVKTERENIPYLMQYILTEFLK